jgi:hypothetical protein
MPAYIYTCPKHGDQERFKCEVGQTEIECYHKDCEEVATRELKPHRVSFSCDGGYDSGFQSK